MNLHGSVRAASIEGSAQVVLSLDSWPEGKVKPTTHEIKILPPKKGAKSEPVTSQLIKTLVHPERQATMSIVKFSKDGKSLLAGGYPSGILQLFDTTTWKETRRIPTPSGLRSSWEYAQISQNWQSVLTHHMTRKVVKDEKEGKVTQRLQIDGRIDIYDTTTAKRTRSIPLTNRGPHQLKLLPDNKSAIIVTESSFAQAKDRKMIFEYLDLTTGSTKPLVDGQGTVHVAPDGKTAFFSVSDYKSNGDILSTVLSYDLANGKVLRRYQPEKNLQLFGMGLSPDGKCFYVDARRVVKTASEDHSLLVLDSSTLQELGRMKTSGKTDLSNSFSTLLFLPDGKNMITSCDGWVYVLDRNTGKIARSLKGEKFLREVTALSADGKLLVVCGMPKIDTSLIRREPDVMDLPQPRVILLDLANPESKPRTLILPHGSVGNLAIHPKGKIIAVGSYGGVHLLEL